MKTKIRLLGILLLIFSLTGCGQFQSTMEITKNKKMVYSTALAIDSSYLNGVTQLLTKEEKYELQNKGYYVEDIKEGSVIGVVLAKEIKNIDKVSKKEDIEYDLLSPFYKDDSDSKIFKVKKGLFKNKYTAHFKFKNPYANDEEQNTDQTQETESLEYATFTLTLPDKPLSHNAKYTTNEGKQLIWALSIVKANEINFEFELYNRTNIYISIAIGVVLLIIIITIIKKKIQKRKLLAEKRAKEIERQNEAPLNYYFKSDVLKEQAMMQALQEQAAQLNQENNQQTEENNQNNNIDDSMGKPIHENEKIDLMPSHSDNEKPLTDQNQNNQDQNDELTFDFTNSDDNNLNF